ncbi:DUF459 domain-containing protein [Chelativorans sp. Marseille-P2723]|uniref:SGNH/GDSL hydrolase family protein n=1 Tax=Chelativorans sp. Marseille-P2723 TaxID=2709133 RepID=UPI001FEDFD35|nr:DUF459 domain-containing protein [Chelativorans sp. Marseille-P2723]
MPSGQRRAPSRSSAPSATEPQAPAVIEKLDNALTVLVVGDFLASGLAEGLEAAYAESPGVRVVDRANGSSGFVRDDYYDWNGQIGEILEEVNPAVVVVMIGSNDRQQLVVNGQPERPQTEGWSREYKNRVARFTATVRRTGISIIWSGLPPFKSSSMTSDMLAFNDIYKKAVEEAGGTFVDIWDGFADENGAFTFTGPDVNGQPVRLRGSDGINLTRPAKRKLAFYVEQPLNKLLGNATSPRIEPQELENLPPPGIVLGEPIDLMRTHPISLAAPQAGGNMLLDGGPIAATIERSIPAPRAGRADNFSLRKKADAPKSAISEETRTAEPAEDP